MAKQKRGMLVLSRREDESVVAGNGDSITVGGIVLQVKVVSIQRDRVRLGFTADNGVWIHREEVFEEIIRGNQ